MSSSLRKKLEGKHSKLSLPKEQLKDHPAVDNYANGSFRIVPIDMVNPDPNQPRQIFEESALQELSGSIKQNGVLQPIIIRIDNNEKIWLVAGERRFRAAKMAGLKSIPAILTSGNPAEISLIENLQRENLKPVEEAEALARMIDEYNYTQEQLAQAVGKARTTITESLALNKLPDKIKKECRTSDFPKSVLLEVAKQKTDKEMISLYQMVKEGSLKTRDVRDIARSPRKKRTPTAIALDRILFLSNTLSKLELNTSEPTEKEQLFSQLHNLKKAIEKLING